jgi:replication factor A3
MAEATPRIHAEYLGNFIGQTVRVLGKVTSLRGDQATIEAHGSVICVLNRVRSNFSRSLSLQNIIKRVPLKSPSLSIQDSHLTLNNYFEILGKVNSDFTIKVLVATDFGKDIGTLLAPTPLQMNHLASQINSLTTASPSLK